MEKGEEGRSGQGEWGGNGEAVLSVRQWKEGEWIKGEIVQARERGVKGMGKKLCRWGKKLYAGREIFRGGCDAGKLKEGNNRGK